jgi:hypothetical protein
LRAAVAGVDGTLRADSAGVSARLKLSVLKPRNPERVCWGCDKYCRADDLGCANGTDRTPHPIELFGEDWLEWSEANAAQSEQAARAESATSVDPALVFAPVDLINDARLPEKG